MDSIEGRHFFTETYIQYGVGESLLFKYLNYLLQINYTHIGIITSVVYSLNLVFIYLNVKKLSNSVIAFFFTLTAFLLHSFAIYPWPDYYAGLSLSVACYGLMDNEKQERIWRPILAGSFLFLAFLFRNTYLLSLSASMCAYLLVTVYFKSLRSRSLLISIGVFFGLVSSYLSFLFMQGTLSIWFSETIGAGSSQYGIGIRSVLALLERAFLFSSLTNAIVTLFLYGTVFTVFITVFKPNRFKYLKVINGPGLIVLFAFFGVSGILQATLGYELFRIQNACSPIYLVCAFYLGEKFSNLSFKQIAFELKAITAILLVSLLMKFPHGSTLWPLYTGKLNSYEKSEIPYYRGHRFQKSESDYYNGLVKILCAQNKKIVNITMDSSVPFLCGENRNVFALPFFNEQMLARTNLEALNQIKAGEFAANELIVSSSGIVANAKFRVTELGRVEMPETIRFMGPSHPVMVYSVEKR